MEGYLQGRLVTFDEYLLYPPCLGDRRTLLALMLIIFRHF